MALANTWHCSMRRASALPVRARDLDGRNVLDGVCMDECVVVAVGVPRFLEESSVASAVSVRIILSSSSCPVACASRMSRRAGDDF